jgi:putative exosortase-associated protein (TIGR04073 family)
MRQGRVVGVVVMMSALLGVQGSTVWAQDPIHKAGRGVGNVLTCWIELPKNLHLGTQEENPLLGAGWGLIKGGGLAATRLAVGAYEAVTFLIPYPKEYASPYEGMELPDYAWE